MFGEPAFAAGPDTISRCEVQVVCVSNGYVVRITRTVAPEPVAPPAEDGMTEDERIDLMVDALAAFFGYINDKSAGEGWKDAESREKIRAGFKAMAPSGLTRSNSRQYYEPETKQLVFGSKEELLKFLSENV